MKNDLDTFFEEEAEIEKSVKEISRGLLELSDFTVTKSPMELAKAEVAGKRMQRACDEINEHVHEAKKKIGVLMSENTSMSVNGESRELHDVENNLSLIHGDAEAIGVIALEFFKANNREAAFENMNRHYRELVEHVTTLLLENEGLQHLL